MSYTVPAQFSISIQNLLPAFCQPPASSAWQLPLGKGFLAEQQQSANNTSWIVDEAQGKGQPYKWCTQG